MESTRWRLLLEQRGPLINDAQIAHISTTFQLPFLKYYNHLLNRAGPKSENIKAHIKWLKITASLIKVSQMQIILRDLHEKWATKIVQDSAKLFFFVWFKKHLALRWRKMCSRVIQKHKLLEGSKFKEMRSIHASNYVFNDSNFQPDFNIFMGIFSYQKQLNHLSKNEEEELVIEEEEEEENIEIIDQINQNEQLKNPTEKALDLQFNEEESLPNQFFEEEENIEAKIAREKAQKEEEELAKKKAEEEEYQKRKMELEKLLELQQETQKELEEKQKQIENQQKELDERKQKDLEELEKAKEEFEKEKKTKKRKLKRKLTKKGNNYDSSSIASSETDYSLSSYETQRHIKRRNAPSRRSSRRKNEEEEYTRNSHSKSRNVIKTIVVKEKPIIPKEENKSVSIKKRFNMLLHDRVALIIVSLIFAIILIFLFISFSK